MSVVFIHSDVERCLKDIPQGYSGHVLMKALCFHWNRLCSLKFKLQPRLTHHNLYPNLMGLSQVYIGFFLPDLIANHSQKRQKWQTKRDQSTTTTIGGWFILSIRKLYASLIDW